MIPSFFKIKELCENQSLHFIEKKAICIIREYLFLYISKETDIYDNKIIYENIKESNFALINQYKEKNANQIEKTYTVIGFKKTIMIIEKSIFSILHPIFLKNKNLVFCSISKIDDIHFTQINEINSQMKSEIDILNRYFSIRPTYEKEIFKTWKAIIPCISGYLINESYKKTKINRLQNFLKNENSYIDPNYEIINEDEFIELRQIGFGSSFFVKLIYHIQKEELFALKKAYLDNVNENEKLIQREIENHTKIHNQLLPKFIGTNKKKEYVIIEFINGKTLIDINKFQLSYNDKITIIFEIMMNIEFLHRNNFIYRDIKPSNIMLDMNNTAILIDFDRIVKYNENFTDFTNDFTSIYAAPEVNYGQISYECDIYSLGKIIFYILKSEDPATNKINEFIYSDRNDHNIKDIIKMCIKENPTERPSILYIILVFFMNYYSYIKIANLFEYYIKKLIEYYKLDNSINNNSTVQYFIGLIYYEGKIIPRDIMKAIHYFGLSADQNDKDSQFNLGVIYSEGKFVPKDIKKAIYYYELAADQNDSSAQYNLGKIYERGELIQKDFAKAIYYFELAANQNHPEAQFSLGVIYEKDRSNTKNIVKAINYYEIAADQNLPEAQYNLGMIFSKGELIPPNTEKAIYYLTLAAEQNFLPAQYYLGIIYIKNVLVKRDIGKSIHYFKLAANQNDPYSQYNLGVIYLNKEFIEQNINKAIKYFTLAANQNYPSAQYKLGVIYENGISIQCDIKKAIYYYKLAASQNNSDAQFRLGLIYENGKSITRDINKAIYYYLLAANQNNAYAQFSLGLIYFKGELIEKNIEKAIYYFQLAANNNVVEAFVNLGLIYEREVSIKHDINKAIQYYKTAAKFNNSDALFELGYIYITGYHVHYDFKKAIYYFTRAADLKNKRAMFFMGIQYLDGSLVPQNLVKASYYLPQSGNDENKHSYFALGYLYHVGVVFKQDIKKAIDYYKEASSFNNYYAKNNLGIIFKHGFPNEIDKNLDEAIYYFKEVIDKNNDIIAMYNLAHLYFYEEPFKDSFKESIILLIKSSNENFYPSKLLLCLISIMYFGFEHENIIKELKKYDTISHELAKWIYNILVLEKLEDITVFENRFNQLRDIDYIFDHNMHYYSIENEILITNLYKKKLTKNNCKDINSDFYDGFGV